MVQLDQKNTIFWKLYREWVHDLQNSLIIEFGLLLMGYPCFVTLITRARSKTRYKNFDMIEDLRSPVLVLWSAKWIDFEPVTIHHEYFWVSSLQNLYANVGK